MRRRFQVRLPTPEITILTEGPQCAASSEVVDTSCTKDSVLEAEVGPTAAPYRIRKLLAVEKTAARNEALDKVRFERDPTTVG